MVVPFITLETGQLKADIEAVNRSLDNVTQRAFDAVAQSMSLLAEDLISQAQANINSMSGGLAESATVEPAVVEPDEISVLFGFNKEYARQRDQGGTIEPVNAQMLAIPLPPIMTATGPRFASPREEGGNLELIELNGRLFLVEKYVRKGKLAKTKRGEGKNLFRKTDLNRFHWMLVPSVDQQGSGFLTRVVEARKADTPHVIAQAVANVLGGGS